MRMISLELQNICQHKRLFWEFRQGLIGVFGPNGSGKSNAINGGCYPALTNDWSRVYGGQTGAIRQQARGEDIARTVLNAEHAGTNFEIVRQISPSVKHQLTIPGEKPIRKAREIQARLEDALGIQRRLIDDYVFVHQRSLTAFLSATESVRAKSFAHLCGTIPAEKCWDLLGTQIEADRGLAAEVVDDTDEIRRQIGEYETRRRDLTNAVKRAKRQMLDKPAEKAQKEIIDKRLEHGRLIEKRPDQAQKVDVRLSAAREAVKDWKAKQEAYATGRAAHKRAEERAVVAREQLRTYEWAKKRWERRQTREQSLRDTTAAKPKEVPACSETETYESLMLKKLNRQNTAEKYETWLAAKDSGEAECEKCGASLRGDAAQARYAEAEREIPVIQEELAGIEKKLKTRQEYEDKVREYEKDLVTWEANLKAARDAAAEYSEVTEPEKIEEEDLRLTVAAADELYLAVYGKDDDASFECARWEVEQAGFEKERRKTSHREAKERLAEIDKSLGECVVEDAAYEEALQLIARHTNADNERQTSQARLDEVKGFIKTKEEELARVERVLARSQKAREWIAMLSRVREVMHRDNLPRIVHHNALLLMQDGINGTLGDFDSPFRIAPEEDLSLTATFPNGTVMAGEGLSGGQQGVLALAFRWTLGSLFASQVGMLVLDEPTAGLDDRNLDCLENALMGLGRLAKDRGYQVVIITHEERLERVFDQVLTLEKAV